jgi:hypothetical protein
MSPYCEQDGYIGQNSPLIGPIEERYTYTTPSAGRTRKDGSVTSEPFCPALVRNSLGDLIAPEKKINHSARERTIVRFILASSKRAK